MANDATGEKVSTSKKGDKKKKTKSSSKGKRVRQKSSNAGIQIAGSKLSVKPSRNAAHENDGGDGDAKVKANAQALMQLGEMIEAIDPDNIDSKTRDDLKKVYKLVQSVQEHAVKAKHKGNKVSTPASAPQSVSQASIAPKENAPGNGPKSPKECVKEGAAEAAKKNSPTVPAEAPKSPGEQAKDEPTQKAK